MPRRLLGRSPIERSTPGVHVPVVDGSENYLSWVDRELDHKMILRSDDPLVAPLKQLGEPVFVVESNPTVEHIAKILFDYTVSQGFPAVRVTVWETPTSFATYSGE